MFHKLPWLAQVSMFNNLSALSNTFLWCQTWGVPMFHNIWKWWRAGIKTETWCNLPEILKHYKNIETWGFYKLQCTCDGIMIWYRKILYHFWYYYGILNDITLQYNHTMSWCNILWYDKIWYYDTILHHLIQCDINCIMILYNIIL